MSVDITHYLYFYSTHSLYLQHTFSLFTAHLVPAGTTVWAELGLPANTQLMPLKAISRSKGRPSKKDKNRVSAYNPRSAQPTRPTVNAVGDLLYVEKNKCKKCGQYGHSKGTCQGKGYIGSITDAMQAEVYEQRNEEASATRKRKRAAGRVDTE